MSSSHAAGGGIAQDLIPPKGEKKRNKAFCRGRLLLFVCTCVLWRVQDEATIARQHVRLALRRSGETASAFKYE